MIKNWMILGDEAYSNDDKVIGVLRFSSDELNNWKEVAINKIKDAIDKSPIVREDISLSNCVLVYGYFHKNICENVSDFNDFVNELKNVYGMDYSITKFINTHCKEDNHILINFWDKDEFYGLKWENVPMDFTCLINNVILPIHLPGMWVC